VRKNYYRSVSLSALVPYKAGLDQQRKKFWQSDFSTDDGPFGRQQQCRQTIALKSGLEVKIVASSTQSPQNLPTMSLHRQCSATCVSVPGVLVHFGVRVGVSISVPCPYPCLCPCPGPMFTLMFMFMFVFVFM
jgi:hypothetical protein